MFLNVQPFFIDTITFSYFDEIMWNVTVLTSMLNIYIELKIFLKLYKQSLKKKFKRNLALILIKENIVCIFS